MIWVPRNIITIIFTDFCFSFFLVEKRTDSGLPQNWKPPHRAFSYQMMQWVFLNIWPLKFPWHSFSRGTRTKRFLFDLQNLKIVRNKQATRMSPLWGEISVWLRLFAINALVFLYRNFSLHPGFYHCPRANISCISFPGSI